MAQPLHVYLPKVENFKRLKTKKYDHVVDFVTKSKGIIRINEVPLYLVETQTFRVGVLEFLILIGEERLGNVDICVCIHEDAL